MPARITASLIGLGLLLAGSRAYAQTADTPTVLHFEKPALSATYQAKKDEARPRTIAPANAPFKMPPLSLPPSRPAVQDWGVRPISFQPSIQPNEKSSGQNPPAGGDLEGEYSIQLAPPGPQQVFKLESEEAFQERMRQEGRQRPTQERIQFPEEPIVGAGPAHPRNFKPMQMAVEPNYLCYDRLYFERINTERYGWDLGFIQPFLSTGEFYLDLALLPYHMWTDPCRNYDSNAGYCLPGDPVAYRIYPPELSLTGALAEGATIVGLLAVFP
jgi:hypothetical protein